MTTQVNSPFLLAKLRPVDDMTAQENNYHDQIERILQQLYRRSGGAVDVVSAVNVFDSTLASEVFDVRQQIGSGIAVTIDTTGFTIDTTEQTTDMTES